MHLTTTTAKNAEEQEEQRNIELSQMKETLRVELESKMYEMIEGRISSDIENRMMQRMERRLNEERQECKAEIQELRFENQQMRQTIKDL